MNNIREWTPALDDTYMTVAEWEESVEAGGFIDYDGSGYFCNPESKLELMGFNVYPSMVGSPAYEQRKVEWTHINWFNR
jgi:hypothetical protein